VAEHAAVPDAFQRGDFIVAGSASGLECETGIGAYGDREDLVLCLMIPADGEPFGRSQLVVRVERRGVTDGAAVACEELFAACGGGVELVGIR
jgi:hypothetical protein